jgi:hypothetical protein
MKHIGEEKILLHLTYSKIEPIQFVNRIKATSFLSLISQKYGIYMETNNYLLVMRRKYV